MTAVKDLPANYMGMLPILSQKDEERINHYNNLCAEEGIDETTEIINNCFVPKSLTPVSSSSASTKKLVQSGKGKPESKQYVSESPLVFLNDGNRSFSIRVKIVSNIAAKTQPVTSLLKTLYFSQSEEGKVHVESIKERPKESGPSSKQTPQAKNAWVFSEECYRVVHRILQHISVTTQVKIVVNF
jgi:hypothetical protein